MRTGVRYMPGKPAQYGNPAEKPQPYNYPVECGTYTALMNEGLLSGIPRESREWPGLRREAAARSLKRAERLYDRGAQNAVFAPARPKE